MHFVAVPSSAVVAIAIAIASLFYAALDTAGAPDRPPPEVATRASRTRTLASALKDRCGFGRKNRCGPKWSCSMTNRSNFSATAPR